MSTRCGRSSSAPTTTSPSRSRCRSSRRACTPSCAGCGAGFARRSPMPALPDETGTIGLIVERRHLETRALVDLRRSLVAAGWRLDVVVPDAESVYGIPADPPPWDLAMSRGRDLAGLGILATAAAAGIPALNTPAAIELVRNKVAMHATLLRHGVPVPATWFARHPRPFAGLDARVFPLVVKPFDGDGSAGVSPPGRPEEPRP